jgi:hypothetical protein
MLALIPNGTPIITEGPSRSVLTIIIFWMVISSAGRLRCFNFSRCGLADLSREKRCTAKLASRSGIPYQPLENRWKMFDSPHLLHLRL